MRTLNGLIGQNSQNLTNDIGNDRKTSQSFSNGFLLFSFILFSNLVLLGCNPSSRKEAPPKDYREEVVGKFRTGRIYNKYVHPSVTCEVQTSANKNLGESKVEKKFTVDFFQKSVSFSGSLNKAENLTFTDSRLRPLRMGSEMRKWEIHSGEWSQEKSVHILLNMEKTGMGSAMVQISRTDRSTCQWCSNSSDKYLCKDDPLPFEEKFIQASCDGDLEFVRMFIREVPGYERFLNEVGVSGETALTCAFLNNHKDVVEVLLNQSSKGLTLDAANLRGQTVLLQQSPLLPGYLDIFLKRLDFDLNRVDLDHKSVLFSTVLPRNQMEKIINDSRFDRGLLDLKATNNTSGFGALLLRASNEDSFSSIVRDQAYRLDKKNWDIEEIEGLSSLEWSLLNNQSVWVKFFYYLQPNQDLSHLKKVSMDKEALLFSAVKSCDIYFFKDLYKVDKFNYNSKDRYGKDLMTVLFERSCYNENEFVSLLEKKGLLNPKNVVAVACKGDPQALEISLKLNSSIYENSEAIFSCIYDKIPMLDVLSRSGRSVNKNVVLKVLADKVLPLGNRALLNSYLKDNTWFDSLELIRLLKASIDKKQYSLGDLIDYLVSSNSLTKENLAGGIYGNYLFDLIANDDFSRLESVLNSRYLYNAQEWPQRDLSNDSKSLANYEQSIQNILSANSCDLGIPITESLEMFAERLGKTKAWFLLISKSTRQGDSKFWQKKYSCVDGRNISLFSALNAAVRACDSVAVKFLKKNSYSIGGGFVDGDENFSNKMTYISPFDTLILNDKCSEPQTQAILEILGPQLSRGFYGREILNHGPQLARVLSYFQKDRVNFVQPFIPFDLVSADYKGLIVDVYGSDSFRNRTIEGSSESGRGSLLGAARYALVSNGRQVGGSPWANVTADRRYIVSFSDLRDYIYFDLNDISFSKKDNCLVLGSQNPGKYSSPRLSSLSVKSLKTCEHQMVIYFDPAKSESELPIREHVKFKMKYSLDGLD